MGKSGARKVKASMPNTSRPNEENMKPIEREALESAARLLEALRIESGVGRILGDWEKGVYEAVEKQINEALEAGNGEG
jgi:hypothetical protein